MSTAKIKNLILAALVLINVFFLIDVLWEKIGEAAERRQITENLTAIMEKGGIELHSGAIGEIRGPAAQSTVRDPFGEATIARAVLGDCELVESGTRARYESGLGEATFNTRGEFVITARKELAASDGEPARYAKRLLRAMKLDASEPVATGSNTATAVCEYRGTAVFNCVITFEFDGEGLVTVSGRRPSGVSEAPDVATRDLPTLLLGFLSLVRDGGADCTSISSVEAGYRLSVGAFGDGSLSPGWRVETDVGAFFLDAVTGAIETAE
ncbi:MAG: hypothetical protein LBN99_04165 [Oscillospiraceae bacterium]|jgi:hypothetical protein|nr:hypothetical protein [Oscillospiraceae bacterium]